MNIICKNRKATFEYILLQKYTAGMILTGEEIKSIRGSKCGINESYIGFKDARPVIYNMHIVMSVSKNPRGLLLKKTEINKLLGKLDQSNLTLVPLMIFISNSGFAKVEFALCQGKKLHDKRESIKKRETDLMMRRTIRI